MRCWNCGEEMIWGSDSEDLSDDRIIVSHFSCNTCGASAEHYSPPPNWPEED